MKLFKTLAVYAAALLSPLGGHVGPGLVAAVSSAVTAEDSKEGGSVSTLQITDMVLTDETELTQHLILPLRYLPIDFCQRTPRSTRHVVLLP